MHPQKPMQKAELDLLGVIVRLHATRGPINRDMLSVEARGQGLEFGRALSVLRGAGLVEEVVKKPFFLSRLLGAKPIAQIRPTASGLALLAPMADVPAETAATPDDAPIETPIETALEILPETPADAPLDAPVDAAPTPEVAPAPPRARSPRPKPLPVNAYTDELGGIPDEDVALVPAFQVAPAIIDGLRDMLDVIAMPMTFAGEALVADRMAKGMAAGDALIQVVLFGFAHAIRLDSETHGTLDLAGMAQYGDEVLAELEKLHHADAITADRFAADSAAIRALLGGGEPNRTLAESLILSDPVAGAAPPALLPEDLRLPGEDIGQPTY
ncbi:MAG: hypothetical protein CFE34_08235 [Rhodobacteraceae bacterium PARR1]|nr:MAG: hypothetical protein CFE34_08235 [Rhodobacteraceae bacterium PARR1]